MKYANVLLKVLAGIAGVLLGGLVLLITAGVVSRYAFDRPITGIIEITEWALLVITLFTAPWIMSLDSHVRVDIITRVVEAKAPRARWAMALVAECIGFVVSLVMVYYGVLVSAQAFASHKVSLSYIPLPLWPLYALIPFSFALMAIVFAWRFWIEIRRRRALAETVGEEEGV